MIEIKKRVTERVVTITATDVVLTLNEVQAGKLRAVLRHTNPGDGDFRMMYLALDTVPTHLPLYEASGKVPVIHVHEL